MKKLIGLSSLVLVLAACGKSNSEEQTDAVQAGEKITFNDEIKSALSKESTTLPMAMIVKVDLDAAGKEDLSKAEVRAANVVSSDAQSTWNSGAAHTSPSDNDKFVVVNPPQSNLKGSGVSDYSYNPNSNPNGNSGSESYESNMVGSNGVVVTGNNNYAYYNSVTNNTLNYDATSYSYNVRPTPYQQAPDCDDRYKNDGQNYERPNKPDCQNGYNGNNNSNNNYNNGYNNNSNNYGNSWNFSGESYYNYGYRPVYRSRNYSVGGIFGYWGFFVVPVRFVQGNSCYYVYQRPYHRR